MLKINTLAAWLLVGLCLSLTPGLFAKKKKEPVPQAPAKQAEPKVDITKLVWPQPPDIARIRYIQELRAEPKSAVADVAPKKKKQGWMDRVAGVDVHQGESTKLTARHYLMKPYGVVADSKGRIYVADMYVGAIFIFDTEANKVSFIRNGVDARFKTLVGLAMDDNDRLFAADAGLHHVSVFNADGKFENSFGDDVLARPNGVAIDVQNRFLYVVDVEKEQIAVFDADSFKLLRYVGGPAKKAGDEAPGTFAKPSNVAVDSDGNVYVCDTMNNRIQIFDAEGQFVSMFGKNGDGVGTFTRPKGIGIDRDGHIWVADAMQNRVQVFDKNGGVLAYFGSFGSLPGQFGLATGLFVDKNNRVMVADQLKGRVQVFRYTTDAEVAALKAEREKKEGTSPTPGTASQAAAPTADTSAAPSVDPQAKDVGKK